MLARARRNWDRLTSGWLGSVIYIILGFLIAIGVNAALAIALNTATPVVAVFSDSMAPTLQRGDMVIVLGVQDIAPGDIIVFDAGRGYPIIHRVVDVADGGIRTKGDHNLNVDPWIIGFDDVYGKAAVRVPLLGWVKIAFMSAISFLR